MWTVAPLSGWEAPSLRYQLLLEPGTGAPGEPRGQVVFLAGVREVARVPVFTASPGSGGTPGTPAPGTPTPGKP